MGSQTLRVVTSVPMRTGGVARFVGAAQGAGCGVSTAAVALALDVACYASFRGPTVAAEAAAFSAYRLGAGALACR